MRLHACVWLVLRRSQASPHNALKDFVVNGGGLLFDFTYVNFLLYVFPARLTGKRPALFGGTRPAPRDCKSHGSDVTSRPRGVCVVRERCSTLGLV